VRLIHDETSARRRAYEQAIRSRTRVGFSCLQDVTEPDRDGARLRVMVADDHNRRRVIEVLAPVSTRSDVVEEALRRRITRMPDAFRRFGNHGPISLSLSEIESAAVCLRAIELRCPRCGSMPGVACRTSRSERFMEGMHAERLSVADGGPGSEQRDAGSRRQWGQGRANPQVDMRPISDDEDGTRAA